MNPAEMVLQAEPAMGLHRTDHAHDPKPNQGLPHARTRLATPTPTLRDSRAGRRTDDRDPLIQHPRLRGPGRVR